MKKYINFSSKSYEEKLAILSQFREIYDGSCDGGRYLCTLYKDADGEYWLYLCGDCFSRAATVLPDGSIGGGDHMEWIPPKKLWLIVRSFFPLITYGPIPDELLADL